MENHEVNQWTRIQKLLVKASQEEKDQQYSSSSSTYIKSLDTLLTFLKSEKNERCQKVIKSQAKVFLNSIKH
jgi:hypothetical protein